MQITGVEEVIAARSIKSVCEKIVKDIFLCLNKNNESHGQQVEEMRIDRCQDSYFDLLHRVT